MRSRRVAFLIAASCLVVCSLFVAPASSHAQQTSARVATSQTTYRAETGLVLVDAVVTDKKGNYIGDLTQKDFNVWEDGKEQSITSFSFEQSAASPGSGTLQYLVLFFDNSSMNVGDQAKARDAAAKFVDTNAGSGRLTAIVDFDGTAHISQNFTANAARLEQALKGLKGSSVSPNGQSPVNGAPFPTLSQAEADFGVHTVLLAVRRLAQSLSVVPGRKTLVMLTSGFPLDFETQSEMAAVVAACNKSNVAVYPIDVRGLTVPDLPLQHGRLGRPLHDAGSGRLLSAALQYRPSDAAKVHLQAASFTEPHPFLFLQHPGTGGSGGHPSGPPASSGGGSHGVPAVGSRPATGGYNTNVYSPPPVQPRIIVPDFPSDANQNQQVLYQLAEGTGGFVIVNSNDLLAGLEKIAKDQSQYYLLGYKPPESNEGRCHTIKVKVERTGTAVRARSGYCNVRPLDLLAGTPVEKDLENHVTGDRPDNVSASMEAPFFYSSPNTARVDLAIDIPSHALKFEGVKGKQHAAVNILGIAYQADGSVAARFSDTANVDLNDKKQVEQFLKQPFHYENQFELVSGNYNLKVVFTSGSNGFGKIEMPLLIEPYHEKQFSISAVALSNDIRQTSDGSIGLDSELLENKTPLLVQGLEFLPSASNRFKKTDVAALYAEVYEPLLKDPNPPEVAYELFVRERKTGAEKLHIGQKITKLRVGNPVIPFGVKLPVDSLGPGGYRVELRAVDSVGNSSTTRVADFEVE